MKIKPLGSPPKEDAPKNLFIHVPKYQEQECICLHIIGDISVPVTEKIEN